jgi:phosphoribosylformylglycinamidine (FGAM) synthase PurS component
LTVHADSSEAARETVDSLASDFLANPLIERWEINAL